MPRTRTCCPERRRKPSHGAGNPRDGVCSPRNASVWHGSSAHKPRRHQRRAQETPRTAGRGVAVVRPLPSVRVQSLATALAVAAAVALPQAFHLAGAASGVGAGLGQALLPMHLPVLLVGLLAAQVAVSSIWTSVADGLPGLVLQWVLVPAVLALVERASRHV